MIFNDETFIEFFECLVFESLGREENVLGYHFMSGGNINNSVRLNTSAGSYFVKWNEQAEEDIFEKEAAGLDLLRSAKAFDIPEVLGYGKTEGKSFLLLEYIDAYMQAHNYWEDMGEKLAKLHRNTSANFGLDYDNYIGSLAQFNKQHTDGAKFYSEQRLRVQAGLAFYNGKISKTLLEKVYKVCEKLPDLIPSEKPALLHGDLWIGNIIIGRTGNAMLIDPAVYYGLREAEIAFSKLFGGFDDEFYAAYQDIFPLAPGFKERIDLYNLYPLLVHVNLFGAGYLGSVERILKKYV